MSNVIDHTRKVNRALALSQIGRHERSAAAMLAAIPAEVISTCPARIIAQILDANWRLAQESKALAARESVAEGCVWDAERGQMRELVQ